MTDDEIFKYVSIAGCAVIGLLGAIGLAVVTRDTFRRRGKFGVNAAPTACPACGETVPTVRKPANRRETLWGGWTCTNCGCEIDKWGKRLNCPDCDRPVQPMSRPKDLQKCRQVEVRCEGCGAEFVGFRWPDTETRRRVDY